MAHSLIGHYSNTYDMGAMCSVLYGHALDSVYFSFDEPLLKRRRRWFESIPCDTQGIFSFMDPERLPVVEIGKTVLATGWYFVAIKDSKPIFHRVDLTPRFSVFTGPPHSLTRSLHCRNYAGSYNYARRSNANCRIRLAKPYLAHILESQYVCERILETVCREFPDREIVSFREDTGSFLNRNDALEMFILAVEPSATSMSYHLRLKTGRPDRTQMVTVEVDEDLL